MKPRELPFGDSPRAPKAIGERDLPILLAHRLVAWNSSCSPRAASKLAHETNTGSDSRCCYPRLAESSDAAEPMFAYEDREAPERERSVLLSRGSGESRGRSLTDAGIRTRRCPDFCGTWQAVTTTPAGLGTPGGSKASSRQRPIDRGRKALFPETRFGRSRRRAPRRARSEGDPEALLTIRGESN